jgi:hypothetical protein
MEVNDALQGKNFDKILKARQIAFEAGRIKEVRLEPGDYIRDMWGTRFRIPLNDPEIRANLLRQELCANTYRETGLSASDFPIQSRSNPFPYKAIVFFVPNNDVHFSAIIYFVHGNESEDPDRRDTLERFISGANLKGERNATLYIYDSASGLNEEPAMAIANMLATDAKLFNDTGAYRTVDVFGSSRIQEENSCSSWSVYFAERVREACIAQRYTPLLSGDFFSGRDRLGRQKDASCAVSVLRMMIERLDSDTMWWGDTSNSNPGKLRQLVTSFVERRVRFRGGTVDQARSAALVDSLVRFYAHDLPVAQKTSNYKATFNKGDPTNTELYNPDIIRLYLLMALTVPNGVVFSTDIDSIAERWARTIERYTALVAEVGTKTWEGFFGQLPSLIMWLYLPPQDVSTQPISRKAPVLIVCRPTYSTGYPNAFARLSHINIYTTNAKSEEATSAIGGDLLNIFYSKLDNYTSDPEQPGVSDDVSFSPTYSCWAYGVIDIARSLAHHEGYLDCVVPVAPQYAASWTRPIVEPIKGLNIKVVSAQRNKMKHILAREHLWGKLMQLLTVDYLQTVMNRPLSLNVSSMLFNSVSTTDPVDIDSTNWRYHQIRPRVFEQAKFNPELKSALRKNWPFFYYNLSFSSVVLGAIRQKLKTEGWNNLSMPCAVWLGVGAAAVLETWASIVDPTIVAPDPANPSMLLMPVLIQGQSVGRGDAQPVCFSVFDIVLIMQLFPEEFRGFYSENSESTSVILQRFYERYGVISGLFSSTQDPYSRVTMLNFTHQRRQRIVSFLGALKGSGTDIDTEQIFAAIAPYNQESFERVAFVCAAFIISKTTM